jgi:hypothetical protein
MAIPARHHGKAGNSNLDGLKNGLRAFIDAAPRFRQAGPVHGGLPIES